MATITEDYVSFEIAKLLKEKGFPQEYNNYHSMVYNEEDYEDKYEVQRMVLKTQIVKAGTLSSYPVGVPEPKCYCPTLQMAMKWLRNTFHLEIYPFHDAIQENNDWWYRIELHSKGCSLTEHESDAIYKTYEEACEEAIKYCLKNLI